MNYCLLSLVCLLVWVGSVLRSQQAFGQVRTSSVTSSAQVSAEFTRETQSLVDQKIEDYRLGIEERARQLLDKEFLQGRALLIVTVRPDLVELRKALASEGSLSLTTLPNNVSRGKLEQIFLEKLPTGSMKQFVAQMVIDVTVDRTVPESQRKLIERVLQGTLNLPKNTEIKMQISDLSSRGFTEEMAKIEKERAASEVERRRLADEAARAVRDRESVAADKRAVDIALRQEQQKIVLLTQENDTIKARLLEYEEKIRSYEQSVRKYEEEINIYKTPLGDIKKIIKGLELPLTILPVAVFLLIGLIVVTAILNGGSKKRSVILRESLELVSGALVSVHPDLNPFE